MGYSNIRATREAASGGWLDSVFAFLFRLFGYHQKQHDRPDAKKGKAAGSPYTQKDGEVALAFRVGGRYFDSSKNRVFECAALKGKKARRVLFTCLDRVEEDKAFAKSDPELATFNKVRIVGGVETCERGNLRADRFATEKEVAVELAFLSKLRAGVKRDFPAAGVVGIYNKTTTQTGWG